MVIEFVSWLLGASILQLLLQRLAHLSALVSLLIAAPLAALAVTAGLCLINGRFRRHARQVTARVEKTLPPLRTGGLPRAEVAYTWEGQTFHRVLTLEEAAQAGDTLPLWALGRRAQGKRPSLSSDFRILALCLGLMALAALGHLCTLLLPDPTAKKPN